MEKIMFFLIGKDNTNQGSNGIDSLSNRFRASEIPDKVERWINELQNAAKHPSDIFVEELLLAHESFYENEFFDLATRIENGLLKALEAFKRWMDPWTHLPLYMSTLRN